MKPSQAECRAVGMKALGIKPRELCPLCWTRLKHHVDKLGARIIKAKAKQ